MAFQYKIDVMKTKKKKGYSTYILRKEKLLGESAIQKLRKGDLPSWRELDKLCALLELPFEEIIERVSDEE